MEKTILVGDIGGTKCDLGIITSKKNILKTKTFASKEYKSLNEIVAEFVKGEEISEAYFGVPGVVKENECSTTNLPWLIKGSELENRFQIKSVTLLNDIELLGYGVLNLEPTSFYTLNKGVEKKNGTKAMISPGTGLGEGLMICNRGGYTSISSEGGHVDFAPGSEKEIELYRQLEKKFGHVSYEKVLSGSGICEIYYYLSSGKTKSAEEITQKALEFNGQSVEKETLNLFCEILGREAGNLALKVCAFGGVYIGGGISLKILEVLKEKHFMNGFKNKGRFQKIMETIPIRIILEPKTPLFGGLFLAKNRKKEES